MITIRKAEERGGGQHGWLDTRHTFSFADYYDPKHVEFGALRVLNDDRVAAGAGFPTHGHRDMEILTYVLEGALAHKDSIGTGSTIRPGDLQRMSAGTGVQHSEFNASKDEKVHFLQIWIQPKTRGIAPGYEQKTFGDARKGKLALLASEDGRDGSVTVHQNACVYATLLGEGEKVTHVIGAGRRVWVHVAEGAVSLDGAELAEGDGAALTDEKTLSLVGRKASNVLVFDLGS
jgi:redox-sensitive bicupin YhaK (pirin superfamily)